MDSFSGILASRSCQFAQGFAKLLARGLGVLVRLEPHDPIELSPATFFCWRSPPLLAPVPRVFRPAVPAKSNDRYVWMVGAGARSNGALPRGHCGVGQPRCAGPIHRQVRRCARLDGLDVRAATICMARTFTSGCSRSSTEWLTTKNYSVAGAGRVEDSQSPVEGIHSLFLCRIWRRGVGTRRSGSCPR